MEKDNFRAINAANWMKIKLRRCKCAWFLVIVACYHMTTTKNLATSMTTNNFKG